MLLVRNAFHRLSSATNHARQPFSRSLASKNAEAQQVNDSTFSQDQVIHGYKLKQVDYIKELNIKLCYLVHEATGAEHLHIHKDGDSNNVFAVSLRTTPKNSTGVAHILEHVTLCGSKKYAVRDPFFKMTTRSLATFMNAMTGPDFTVYPFATQNKKDYENLLSVYTDAVFFPRLRPVDFRQEGWRLEHEKPDDKETPIVIRGVVYNEMKGAFSSSSTIYARQLLNHLFPENTYRYESGGDPQDIPNLSHEELKKFHKLHYHPSNAKFFTYGDMPLEHHLKILNETVMSKFHENPQAREQSVVKEQEPWVKPRTVDISCPSDPLSADPSKQTTTSLSYLLPTNCTSLEEMFELQLLSTLLLDGPNAPFYKSLIESGLGADYSPSTGFGSYTKQPYFSVGLQNISQNDVSKVHEIIERTFKETADNGFSQERIDAVLHNIELSLKHVSGNFGLRLLWSLESTWNHDGDVIDHFKVNKYVDKFKKNLAADKCYWSKLINKHFLANSHKLILNMNPDPRFEEKRKEREASLLADKIANLNDVDEQIVLYEGMELMKIHESKDDPSVLPCLEPSKDISRDLSYRTQLKFDTFNGVGMQICEQPTNEVVYFRALSDIGERIQAANLIDYLPLFCDVATKLGAGSYDRHQLSQKMQLTTGGLSVSLALNPSLTEFDKFRNEICIGSHCLRRNVNNMFELWTNVFKQIHFQDNKDYLYQLIKASAADLVEGISHSGNAYAIKRSSHTLSNLGLIDETLSGLAFIARMKDIASKESIESISVKLQAISKLVLDPFNLRVAINAEPDAVSDTTDSFKRFIESAQKNYQSDSIDANGLPSSDYEKTNVEDIKFPFDTHFVAKSLVAVPREHKDFAKLVILTKLISSKYLLREVREKGGAYGANASMSSSGILSFSSYRDPNTTKTMDVFDSSARWIAEGKDYTDRDIDESKLGVFRDIDRPVEPSRRGLNFFTAGETDDMREAYRRRLLDVTKKDIRAAAIKYLDQKKFGTHII